MKKKSTQSRQSDVRYFVRSRERADPELRRFIDEYPTALLLYSTAFQKLHPELFNRIDAYFQRQFKHYGVTVYDWKGLAIAKAERQVRWELSKKRKDGSPLVVHRGLPFVTPSGLEELTQNQWRGIVLLNDAHFQVHLAAKADKAFPGRGRPRSELSEQDEKAMRERKVSLRRKSEIIANEDVLKARRLRHAERTSLFRHHREALAEAGVVVRGLGHFGR